jgi:hypothetical protein
VKLDGMAKGSEFYLECVYSMASSRHARTSGGNVVERLIILCDKTITGKDVAAFAVVKR